MDIETLTSFFLWMAIINGTLITLISVLYAFASDWMKKLAISAQSLTNWPVMFFHDNYAFALIVVYL